MSTEPIFVKVARFSELRERRSIKVTVGDDEIALWRIQGSIYAISNVCSHQHISTLHLGTLSGRSVTCPMHGWTYSLETGIALSGNGSVKTYHVKVVGDDVFVEQPSSTW
jgi:3-phenylpropionate/trans-cinnamate dioxygenase ferredoxin subunit